jgi:hypothetical protein
MIATRTSPPNIPTEGRWGKSAKKTNQFNAPEVVWRSRQGLNPQPPRSKRGTLSS